MGSFSSRLQHNGFANFQQNRNEDIHDKVAMDGYRRGRDRRKKYWREVIKQVITQLQLTEDMTLDRRLWRTWIRIDG
ncbi:hypothetical protein H5410_041366 [Solanum commersonii]|uniref:Uncharacterized protein n=1 Tax=Solanum commersonii TaxID=4109 RepID=A0A9J5XUB4_SOLCO|nr:hypothetical protein H5410_041366 [Solanum commersonii]